MNRSLGPFLLLLMLAVASSHATAQSLNHHLLRAAARGDSAAVAWAIERGADANACVRLDPYADDLLVSDTLGGIVAHHYDGICLAPLSAALLNGHAPVVRLLMRSGADPKHGAELSFGRGMTSGQREALRLYLDHLSDGENRDSLIDDRYDRRDVAIAYLKEGTERENAQLSVIASDYLTPAERSAALAEIPSNIRIRATSDETPPQADHTSPDTVARAFLFLREDARQSGNNRDLLDYFRRHVGDLLSRRPELLEIDMLEWDGAPFLESKENRKEFHLSDEERKEYYRIIYDALRNDRTLDGRPGILPWLARVAADRSAPSRRDDEMIIELMAERIGKEDVAEVSAALGQYVTELSHPERQIGGYDTASVEKVITLLRRHGADPWVEIDPHSGKRSASERSAPLWYVLLSRPATWPAARLMDGMRVDSAFEGLTPLHLLVGTSYDDARNAIPLIRRLLDRGVDVDSPGVGGVTPLYLALAHAPHLMSEQETMLLGTCAVPLDASSIDAYELLITFLLEKGADPNHRDENGLTPLHLAAANASPSIVRALLDAGADPSAVSAGGITPMMIAARRKNGEIVDLLAEEGEDLTRLDADARTLLHALFLTDLDTIGKRLSGRVRESIFESSWCRVPALTGRDPRFPPLVRTEPYYILYGDDAYEMVPLLVEAGVDPNARDRDERTALHLLALEPLHVEPLNDCYYGDEAHIDQQYAMLTTLIDNGADIEAVDRLGLRPLHYAALSGSPCLIDLMLEAGADPDARTADERRMTAEELRELIQ